MKTIPKFILLKTISIPLLILSTLSCNNPAGPEEKIIFEEIENPDFDKKVTGKIYYSELSDNIQSKLEFNTDQNSLTITQYHWDSENAPTWDYIYSSKYDYLFNKELSKIGAKLTSYYKTDSEGLGKEGAYALSKEPQHVNFQQITNDYSVIEWNGQKYYTDQKLQLNGLQNHIKTRNKPTFQEKDNPSFENIVKDKIFYTEWDPLMQDSLEFDTENKIVTFKQYYTSRYIASEEHKHELEKEPDYPFDYIYVRKSKYYFNEDNSKIATKTLEHYRTNMSGGSKLVFDDFNGALSLATFTDKNKKGTEIEWKKDTYYTAEEMKAQNIPNFILNPIK